MKYLCFSPPLFPTMLRRGSSFSLTFPLSVSFHLILPLSPPTVSLSTLTLSLSSHFALVASLTVERQQRTLDKCSHGVNFQDDLNSQRKLSAHIGNVVYIIFHNNISNETIFPPNKRAIHIEPHKSHLGCLSSRHKRAWSSQKKYKHPRS